jgi:hypothetical protein
MTAWRCHKFGRLTAFFQGHGRGRAKAAQKKPVRLRPIWLAMGTSWARERQDKLAGEPRALVPSCRAISVALGEDDDSSTSRSRRPTGTINRAGNSPISWTGERAAASVARRYLERAPRTASWIADMSGIVAAVKEGQPPSFRLRAGGMPVNSREK